MCIHSLLVPVYAGPNLTAPYPTSPNLFHLSHLSHSPTSPSRLNR